MAALLALDAALRRGPSVDDLVELPARPERVDVVDGAPVGRGLRSGEHRRARRPAALSRQACSMRHRPLRAPRCSTGRRRGCARASSPGSGKKLVRAALVVGVARARASRSCRRWLASRLARACVRRKARSHPGLLQNAACEPALDLRPRRSLPQNGSPSTTKNGAPKTPLRDRVVARGLEASLFQRGSVQTRSASPASATELAPAPSGASAIRKRSTGAAREVGAQAMARQFAARSGSRSSSHQKTRAAFCVGDRKLLRQGERHAGESAPSARSRAASTRA